MLTLKALGFGGVERARDGEEGRVHSVRDHLVHPRDETIFNVISILDTDEDKHIRDVYTAQILHPLTRH